MKHFSHCCFYGFCFLNNWTCKDKTKNEKWFFNHLKYILYTQWTFEITSQWQTKVLNEKEIIILPFEKCTKFIHTMNFTPFLNHGFYLYVIILLSIVNMICNIFCFISRIWNIIQNKELSFDFRYMNFIYILEISFTWIISIL